MVRMRLSDVVVEAGLAAFCRKRQKAA